MDAANPQGLTLAFFKQFVDTYGGRDAFQGLTTEQVCHRFVIPHTESGRLSLVDHVKRNDPNGDLFVRPATWFVSHAWNYLFLEVIDALDHFMDEQGLTGQKGSTGLWFCLFNNNQHEVKGGARPFLHWYTTFKTALIAIENVVMVFSPWNNPTTLTRTWCVFEVFVAIECNARFEVAMGKTEKEAFLAQIQEGDVLETMHAKINSAHSTTSFPSDRDHICDLIEKGPGFQHLDRMVFATLEAWVIRTLDTQIAVASTAESRLQWLFVKGDLCSTQGGYADAESNFQWAVAIHDLEKKRPMLHWRAVAWLAYTRVRRHDEQRMWEPLFLDALAHQEEHLGPSHDHTLETMRCLGDSYCHVELYSLGMPLLYRCYENSLRERGPDNKWAMSAARVLGNYLMRQAHLLDAQEWLERAHEAYKRVFGDDHYDTCNSGSSLAVCYGMQGEIHAATALLERIYYSRLRTLGPDAHATMVSLRNLSSSVCSQGKYEDAERHLIACHARFLALDDETWACNCLRALGKLYLCMESHTRAKPILDAAHETLKCMLGSTHLNTREVVYLRLLVAMECREDVDSMEKIASLETLLVEAHLQHETWTNHPCHGCFAPVQGHLCMCPACPRYSLWFCQVCVRDNKFVAKCTHAPTTWICLVPPARFLHEARLSVLSKSAMWIEYDAALNAYQSFCELHSVADRVDDVRLNVAHPRRMTAWFIDNLSVCVGVVLGHIRPNV
ncbi:Aste57867_11737 [Aphanomyces stellatus]|uniref:Aste57867_11737 protein n=1 Tax=Aphanomyces stellatus TaxID=120398 RepID=A0A485KVQ5_9STRA|nr:hypothetical protein As57867_011693 [Aphanomyces stellatus]VFT88593.1 Aste57867_11737 [Aphanomyces stellatus]